VRIAPIIEHFEPGAGGVENVAWRVAHGLQRAADTVDVIARRAVPSSELSIRLVRAPALWQPLRVLAFSHAAGSHPDYMDRCYHGPGRALRALFERVRP